MTGNPKECAVILPHESGIWLFPSPKVILRDTEINNGPNMVRDIGSYLRSPNGCELKYSTAAAEGR